MTRIQKSICDQCGKEVITTESFNIDGLNIRVGHDMVHSYLHDTDFCSIECIMKAFDGVLSTLNRKMKESIKERKTKVK